MSERQREITCWFVVAALALLPQCVLPFKDLDLRAAKVVCSIIAIASILSLHLPNKWLGAWLFLTGLTLLFNPWIALANSWMKAHWGVTAYLLLSPQSISALVNTVLFLTLYYLVASHWKPRMTKNFLNVLCYVSIFQAGYQVIQTMDLDPLFKALQGVKDLPVGWMGDKNSIGTWHGIALAAFLRPGWCFLLIFPVTGLLISHCATGTITGLVVLVSYLVLQRKNKRQYVIYAMVFLASMAITYATDGRLRQNMKNPRIECWKRAVTKLVAVRPVTGCGLGNWKNVFPKVCGNIQTERWKQAHNEYIQVLTECGIPAFILFMGAVITAFKRLRWRQAPTLALVTLAICVAAGGMFIGRLAQFGFLICCTAGIIDAEYREAQDVCKKG